MEICSAAQKGVETKRFKSAHLVQMQTTLLHLCTSRIHNRRNKSAAPLVQCKNTQCYTYALYLCTSRIHNRNPFHPRAGDYSLNNPLPRVATLFEMHRTMLEPGSRCGGNLNLFQTRPTKARIQILSTPGVLFHFKKFSNYFFFKEGKPLQD